MDEELLDAKYKVKICVIKTTENAGVGRCFGTKPYIA